MAPEPLLGVHRVTAGRVLLTLVKMGFIGTFGVTVGFLMYQALRAQTTHGWGFWLLAALSVIFGVLGPVSALSMVPAIASAGVKVEIAGDGLTYRRPGGQPVFYPWTDITFTTRVEHQLSRRGTVISTSRRYTVTRPGGPRIVLDHHRFFTIARLGSQIATNVAQAQVPRVAQTLVSGGSVVFGPFRADGAGLSHRGAHLAWRSCLGVEIERGVLAVRGPVVTFARHDVGAVPNAIVLILVAEIMKTAAHRSPL